MNRTLGSVYRFRILLFLLMTATLLLLAPCDTAGQVSSGAAPQLHAPEQGLPAEREAVIRPALLSEVQRTAVRDFLLARSGIFGKAVGGTVLSALTILIVLIRALP